VALLQSIVVAEAAVVSLLSNPVRTYRRFDVADFAENLSGWRRPETFRYAR